MEPLPQDPLKVRIETYEVIMKFLLEQLRKRSLADKLPILVACETTKNLQDQLKDKQAATTALSSSCNLLPAFETPHQQMSLTDARLKSYDAIINFVNLRSSNLSPTCAKSLETARFSMERIQEILITKKICSFEIPSSAIGLSDRQTVNSPRSDSYYTINAKKTNSPDSFLGISEIHSQQVMVPVPKDTNSGNGQLATDRQIRKRKLSLPTIEDEPKARHVATLGTRKRSFSTNDINTIEELQCSPLKQFKEHTKYDVPLEGSMKDNKLETVEELSPSLVNLHLKANQHEDCEKGRNVSQNTNKDDGPSTDNM